MKNHSGKLKEDKMEEQQIKSIKIIGDFLTKNGFKKSGERGFVNPYCLVLVEPDCYLVESEWNGQMGHWFSTDLLIYSLIGYLTYNDLMQKNYNK
jgi:hypothetical protein